jgi:hypothetical protein
VLDLKKNLEDTVQLEFLKPSFSIDKRKKAFEWSNERWCETSSVRYCNRPYGLELVLRRRKKRDTVWFPE